SSLIGYFDNQLSLNLKTGHFYIVQRGHYHFFSTEVMSGVKRLYELFSVSAGIS
ncbi:MAG: hypothetical protein UV09_C0003G0001, partial [Candidatus Gottesmanbacteria bacterium GW2011_GWA2_42_18]